jgi:hypothetical protein
LPDQTCQQLDPQCCSDQGGTPLGGAASCAAPQACCLADGSCVDAAPSCCDNLGGTPQGAASQCSASDTDGDGDDNTCDGDDDNDGVADGSDAAPLNPDSCQDADNDTCDDCAVGSDGFGPRPDNDPANDGPDADGDGICDAGETCTNFTACADDDDNGVRDDACKWWACAAGVCQGTNIAFADIGGQFGSCQPDGASDGNDRFHALNCFSNQNTAGGSGYLCEPAPPSATNADAGGPFGQCCPDGVCDGNDAFHALNAFSGTNACSCPANFVCPCPAPTDPPGNPVLCPPGPAPDAAAAAGPEVVAEAGVILWPSTNFVQPGGQVDVQVLLAAALADLRGYQLHVAASGGRRGALRLTDMTIEKQASHVFAGRAFWQAFNLDTQQVLAGLDDAGIHTHPHAYLATFTFQASPDAIGEFTINLLHDDGDRTQRTFLFPTPAGAKIAIDSVDPAVIVVEPRARSRRDVTLRLGPFAAPLPQPLHLYQPANNRHCIAAPSAKRAGHVTPDLVLPRQLDYA